MLNNAAVIFTSDRIADTVRCEETNIKDVRCLKPKGHKGSHYGETPSLIVAWGWGWDTTHNDGSEGGVS